MKRLAQYIVSRIKNKNTDNAKYYFIIGFDKNINIRKLYTTNI